MSYLLKLLLHVGAPDVLDAVLGHGRGPRHGESLLVMSSGVAGTRNNNCSDSSKYIVHGSKNGLFKYDLLTPLDDSTP